MTDIKIVFFDIDGTLIDMKKNVFRKKRWKLCGG